MFQISDFYLALLIEVVLLPLTCCRWMADLDSVEDVLFGKTL